MQGVQCSQLHYNKKSRFLERTYCAQERRRKKQKQKNLKRRLRIHAANNQNQRGSRQTNMRLSYESMCKGAHAESAGRGVGGGGGEWEALIGWMRENNVTYE